METTWLSMSSGGNMGGLPSLGYPVMGAFSLAYDGN